MGRGISKLDDETTDIVLSDIGFSDTARSDHLPYRPKPGVFREPQPKIEAEVAHMRQPRGDENETMCFVRQTQIGKRNDRQVVQSVRPYPRGRHS
jgi:hypothetical protein